MFISKKEFAKMCGMNTSALAVYIGRGNVFVGDDGLVNVKHETNALFIQKRKNKGGGSLPTENTPNTSGAVTSAGETMILNHPSLGQIEVPAYEDSERIVKYFDSLKREKEVKLLEMREAKLRGEVVPTDVIGQIILQHNHSILSSMKNTIEELLREPAKIADIPPADIATLKGKAVHLLNEGIRAAAENTAASMKSVIDNYSNTRGVGEKF